MTSLRSSFKSTEKTCFECVYTLQSGCLPEAMIGFGVVNFAVFERLRIHSLQRVLFFTVISPSSIPYFISYIINVTRFLDSADEMVAAPWPHPLGVTCISVSTIMPAPSSLPPPTKKRKLTSTESRSVPEISLADLENSLLKSTSIPDLAELVQLSLNETSVEPKTKTIFSLYRVFVTYISKDALLTTPNSHKDALWDLLNSYSSDLGSLLASPEDVLRNSALQILLSIQKTLSSAFSKAKTGTTPEWHNKYFTTHIVPAVLENCETGPLAETFVKSYIGPHTDLRWFFMRDAGYVSSFYFSLVAVLKSRQYASKDKPRSSAQCPRDTRSVLFPCIPFHAKAIGGEREMVRRGIRLKATETFCIHGRRLR